jgi:hypothetical protein
MPDTLRSIAVASALAFLLIVMQFPGQLVFAYALLPLCALAIYLQGMLHRKETYQRENANAEKMTALFQQLSDASLNHQVKMMDAVEALNVHTAENKHNFENVCLKLESNAVKIADILDQKMQKFVAVLDVVNQGQMQKQTDNLVEINENYLAMSQSFSHELSRNSQATCDDQANHLEQIMAQLQPVFMAVEAVRDHANKITHTFEASSAELQTIIGEHTAALGHIFDKTMKELVDVSDDNAQEIQDKITSLVNELQNVMRSSQKTQNRTLETLGDDIQTMVNSQQQNQDQSHKTLVCLETFKDELTALNQKDLHLIESILHG